MSQELSADYGGEPAQLLEDSGWGRFNDRQRRVIWYTQGPDKRFPGDGRSRTITRQVFNVDRVVEGRYEITVLCTVWEPDIDVPYFPADVATRWRSGQDIPYPISALLHEVGLSYPKDKPTTAAQARNIVDRWIEEYGGDSIISAARSSPKLLPLPTDPAPPADGADLP